MIYWFIEIIIGGTSPYLKQITAIKDGGKQEEPEITEVPAQLDLSYAYKDEEDILEEILENYDQAVVARKEGYFGLAETKIENALILSQQVDLDKIEDESLVILFKEALISLALENGKILNESSIIAEEDPMAWL